LAIRLRRIPYRRDAGRRGRLIRAKIPLLAEILNIKH
jgi:hypothetical protein